MGGFLIAAIIIASGILGSAFSKILADEFKAWRPNIVNSLIGFAASLLSDIDRDRYHEEWIAYVEEVPGDLGKLLSGVGFVWAAFRMSDRRFMALGAKRVMDISMAVASLVLLSPPLLIVALAIRIESPGPIFFAQRRIGKDGKEFWLYRFRAFHLPSENREAQVTNVGRFIRFLSIDELPQLLNVLKGDMSVVGPRALPTEFLEEDDFQRISRVRHSVRPGITGLGQIVSTKSREDRLYHMLVADMLYVQAPSVFLDVGILVKTVATVCFGEAKTKAGETIQVIVLGVAFAMLTLGLVVLAIP